MTNGSKSIFFIKNVFKLYQKIDKFKQSLLKERKLYNIQILYENFLMIDSFSIINIYANLIIIFIYYERNGFISLKMIILNVKKTKKRF